jgi:hypothetical protein
MSYRVTSFPQLSHAPPPPRPGGRYAFQPELRLDAWVLMHGLLVKHVLLRNSLCTSLALAGPDRRQPFCTANYHWLGFDVDHTLIAYV